MATGVAVKAWRFFFSRAPEDPKLGFMVPSKGIGGTAIRPQDFRKQVAAFTGTIYACVDLRATAVASVPLRFYVAINRGDRAIVHVPTREVSKQQKDYLFSLASTQLQLRSAIDLEEVLVHPVIDLMTNVNNLHNAYDLQELTEVFLSLTGNCYWYIPKNSLGVPAEIWIMPSQYMSIVPGEGNLVKGYIYRRGMKKIFYDASEIIHFKYPSPSTLLYGRSPLAALSAEYNLQNSINKFEQVTADRMGVPPVALELTEDYSFGANKEDKIEEVQKMWDESFGMMGDPTKVPVMEGYKIIHFGFSSRDMNFLAGRKLIKEQMANGYKVPLSMLRTESVNLANAKAGEYQFAKYCVLPEVTKLGQELNQSLCPMYNDRLLAAYDNPVPADNEFMLKERETNLKTGILSINEVRAADGLELLDPEEDPHADSHVPYALASKEPASRFNMIEIEEG